MVGRQVDTNDLQSSDVGFSASILSLFRSVLITFSLLTLSSVADASDDCVPIGKALLPASQQSLDYPALIHRVKDDDIVLLGEHHDNIAHHRWQLQMITGLHTLNPSLVLGFEMFPRRVQAVLDQWINNELSEQDFLKQVDWNTYWRFDPSLYLPILHYARMNHIPIVALNVERSLVRAVGKEGWSAVANKEKEGLGRAAAPSDGYKQMLAGVFMQHGSHHEQEKSEEERLQEILASDSFNHFVESQQVWDRAMAEAIKSARDKNKQAQLVAIMGSGHMMYGFGVPEQLKDLEAGKPSILIPWDPEFECHYIQDDFADAVIGLKPIRFSDKDAAHKHPKIGIYLEEDEAGVKIGKVVSGSVGEKIDLHTGDVIIEMAGETVRKPEDVIAIVKATRFGTWLPLVVIRDGERREFIAKFPTKP